MGVIIMLDMLIIICPSLASKIKSEVLDNLDSYDWKIHFYTVFMYFKQKVDGDAKQTMTDSICDGKESIVHEDKIKIAEILEKIAREKEFTPIKVFIDHYFRSFKS